jgi:hypothetical protein
MAASGWAAVGKWGGDFCGWEGVAAPMDSVAVDLRRMVTHSGRNRHANFDSIWILHVKMSRGILVYSSSTIILK